MIALTLNAAFERIAVRPSDRVPAYLIIDEAAEYFDGTLERLLAQARKFNLGVVFAHQHMDQLSPTLRSAVAANTSIKMAGGVSDHDARLLAPDMRTSPEFISGARKRSRSTEFACHVRNLTDRALKITVPFGALEDAPRMSAGAHDELRDRNRARYGIAAALPAPASVDPGSASIFPADAAIPEQRTTSPPMAETPSNSVRSRSRAPNLRRKNPDEVDMRPSET
jgi:hypothetical protein